MDFITAPLVIGLISYFTYKTFELYARRQERLKLIEKIGQNLMPTDQPVLNFEFNSLLPSFRKKSFGSLRIGCLLTGLGLGLLVGLFLCLFIKFNMRLEAGWERNNLYNVAFSASILLFGGLGLLISYGIESKSNTKKE